LAVSAPMHEQAKFQILPFPDILPDKGIRRRHILMMLGNVNCYLHYEKAGEDNGSHD
jgi:hypothetical protein